MNELIEKPLRSLTTPQDTGLREVGPVGCPNLSQALALARDKCKAASKNKKHHLGYAYASADEVISTANAALEGSGLALLPIKEELVVLPIGNNVIYTINRTFILSHASGEFVSLEVKGFPVNLEGKKTLDKCYLAAMTTSFAYKLRDLLQMPRGDEYDIAGRDDRQPPADPPPQQYQQPEPTPAPQEEPRPNSPAAVSTTPPPATPTEEVTDQEYERVTTYITGKIPPDQLVARVKSICLALGLPVLRKIPRSRLIWLKRVVDEGFATPKVVDQIAGLVTSLGLDWTMVRTRLQSQYQVSSFGHLLPDQAQEVLTKLLELQQSRQSQTAA